MVIMVITVIESPITGDPEKDANVKGNIRKGLSELERKNKDDREDRIVWIGGAYIGVVITLMGIIWMAVILDWISLPWYFIVPLLLIFIGTGIVIFSVWLRKVIKHDDGTWYHYD